MAADADGWVGGDGDGADFVGAPGEADGAAAVFAFGGANGIEALITNAHVLADAVFDILKDFFAEGAARKANDSSGFFFGFGQFGAIDDADLFVHVVSEQERVAAVIDAGE